MSLAEEIAGKLTQAQRRLVLALSVKRFLDWGATGMPGNKSTRDRIAFLTEPGKPPLQKPWFRRLTPLGEQVKRILESQQP